MVRVALWWNEGIKLLNQLAIDACLRYIYTALVHFGSNPKEELLGLFCISDSGQGLRSIKQHFGFFL